MWLSIEMASTSNLSRSDTTRSLFKSLINFTEWLPYLLTTYSIQFIRYTCVHVGAGFLRLGQNLLRINYFPMNLHLRYTLLGFYKLTNIIIIIIIYAFIVGLAWERRGALAPCAPLCIRPWSSLASLTPISRIGWCMPLDHPWRISIQP